MKSCFLLVPFPPSVNRLWRSVKGRSILSATYRDWRHAAGLALNQQHKEHFGGPVSVTVSFGRPDKRRRDLDNYFKAVADLLCEHNVLMDDSLIERLTLQWDKGIIGAFVEIEEI